MTREEVLSNLCIKDTRNPDHEDCYQGFDPDEIPEPRVNCYCDNCFHGRDKLALEILRWAKQSSLRDYRIDGGW